MLKLYGRQVTLSSYLVVAGTPYQRKRSWRERLFSRPWQPWQATQLVVPQIPDPKIYQTPSGLVMHPETWRTLKTSLENQK